MKHVRFAALGLIVVAGLLLPRLGQCADDVYVIIVHRQNTVSSLTKSELGALYLKKTVRWREGVEVMPVDLEATNAVRARFSHDVMGRSVTAMQAYWRKLIFSGQGIPPVELHDDSAVLEYVGGHAGAIGYVSATVDTGPANVRKVKVTD